MTWTTEQAKEHYNISEWSAGYFDVDKEGKLQLSLPEESAAPVNIQSLIDQLIDDDLRLPILIRFANILTAQVTRLYDAFSSAKASCQYGGDYKYIYPIKTNQQRYVVESILSHDEEVGLEAGSKTELLAVLGVANKRSMTIVCNGYKDAEYIRLALIAQELGHRVYLIIELPAELVLILKEAKSLNVEPRLGIRVRLASIAKGRWQNTGGEKSKFGLTAGQLQACVQTLKDTDCLSYLRVLHCHLGSQISTIRDIQKGINECARYFSNLHQLGVRLDCVDIGGGLGVDYEGTHSRNYCSVNYSWQEYAMTVLQAFKAVCDEKELPEPMILTESGRAITAHHAMMVTNIIDVESPEINEPKGQVDSHSVLKQMQAAFKQLETGSAIEVYHDMLHHMEEAHHLFSQGELSIAQRALAESLYQAALAKIRQLLNVSVRQHRELMDLINEKLADKMFCNLSIFQSMPDVWAIKQVFPILPITHLDEPPAMRVILQDLTCDSDGVIEQYVDGQGVETTLPLPRFDESNPYLLGFFMVGAYQEILGDMHNLFGDTDSVHVELDASGEWQVKHIVCGDESEHVLALVNYDVADLKASFKEQVSKSALGAADKSDYLSVLQAALDGYTYLEEVL